MKNTALLSKGFSATDSLRTAVMALQRARIETASLDARLLLQHVLGVSREQLLSGDGLYLDSRQHAAFQELIDKRANRQPLAQLTGKRDFWDLTFKVTEATLDPRPDSETLIEAVLARFTDRDVPLKILDFGSGSGCLLLTLLHLYNNASGMGVDICANALDVARENSISLGLVSRAKFLQGSWGEGVIGESDRFDIVISNPPYIPTGEIAHLAPEVRCFEPMTALDGGADGFDCYRAIMPKLNGLLADHGVAVFEIGMGQQAQLGEIAIANGLRVVQVKDDLAGIPRCVVVTK